MSSVFTGYKKNCSVLFIILLFLFFTSSCNKAPIHTLKKYHNQLQTFHNEFRAVEMPDVNFFLFGMGNRTKILYKDGVLINSLCGEIIQQWPVSKATIIPNDYRVEIETFSGEKVSIFETEKGVFIKTNGRETCIDGTTAPLHLPEFENHRYSEILRVLNQEILVNIVDSKPVPNYFVYKKPWPRDAAMMAMCLQYTGNIELIRDWVLNLDDPYDHNNGVKQGKPESEADNLGQTLYLLSFFAGKNHPLVKKIMAECKKCSVDDKFGLYISGRSDFQVVPVYQTKWLKYGLKSLGMDDPYTIPGLPDNYSSLFWWDYKEFHVDTDAGANDKYPYLGWARDHFAGKKLNPISNRDYPLTWEINASQADYDGMKIIDEVYTAQLNASPHTWHAAEIFLYLIDEKLE